MKITDASLFHELKGKWFAVCEKCKYKSKQGSATIASNMADSHVRQTGHQTDIRKVEKVN